MFSTDVLVDAAASATILQLGGFFEAVSVVLSWPVIGYLVFGLLLGIFLGAMPGVGPAVGMVVMLPLTFPLDAHVALILLTAIYLGGLYGGSIPAIVLNVPGTAPAAATTFDGYPMTELGRAKEALSLSAMSSAIGGVISATIVILMIPFLISFVLLFRTPDIFLMAILGLLMITIVAKGSLVKGLTAGSLGMFFTTVGVSPIGYETRYTFGFVDLTGGLDYIAALLGLFAVAEMIRLKSMGDETIADTAINVEGRISTAFNNLIKHPVVLGKSALIGCFIGAIPGAGSTVSNFVAYAEALRSSNHPDKFGTGVPEGVIASETSNSATVGGSLVPTLAFGIPGSGAAAILLGALILHGMVPGPEMFSRELDVTYSLFVSILLGNFVILAVGLMAIPYVGILSRMDVDRFIPLVLVLGVMGAYALNFNWVDIYYLTLLGVIGYTMKKYNYSVIAFVLGAILGPIAEEHLWRSLQISDGSWMIFVSSPLTATLTALTFIVFFQPLIGYTVSRFR